MVGKLIGAIMSFFGYEKKTVKCEACAAYADQITYLKALVEKLVQEKREERGEYKRAVDVILYKNQIPAIGQGYTDHDKHVDPTKAFSFFEEEIKENK
jgi:hypothetical protein